MPTTLFCSQAASAKSTVRGLCRTIKHPNRFNYQSLCRSNVYARISSNSVQLFMMIIMNYSLLEGNEQSSHRFNCNEIDWSAWKQTRFFSNEPFFWQVKNLFKPCGDPSIRCRTLYIVKMTLNFLEDKIRSPDLGVKMILADFTKQYAWNTSI